MIQNIFPLTFDCFDIRFMATFVEADNSGVAIDLGVSLAPLRST